MMQYQGRHPIFDPQAISTYPLAGRTNKVTLDDLTRPSDALAIEPAVSDAAEADIAAISRAIIEARQADRPVMLFAGAHLIKNGLGLLLADMVARGLVTLVAGNAATSIHDFELAMIGQTSEYVPNALGLGQFGMAYEFAYINGAIALGNSRNLGLGESLAMMICDDAFRAEVLQKAAQQGSPTSFDHTDVSVIAACFKAGIPLTIHAGIGTDVIDQHPSFDGAAKGGCSGRDFLIYTAEIARLKQGGVVLNIGSAVTGPEVLLKAVSMAANTGAAPKGIITADFDIRSYQPEKMTDESAQAYYYRDQKSIVTRIPQAFDGSGYYIEGDQKQTFTMLYQMLTELSGE